jgi:hypothetical protein
MLLDRYRLVGEVLPHILLRMSRKGQAEGREAM